MSETAVPMTSSLSPRANIARLTLQLRAAQREADEAERAEQEWDGEAVAAELRSRLEPMLREQQRAFELELWRARAAAAARVAAVRQELDAARRDREAADAERAAAELAEAERAAAELAEAERAAAELAEAERAAAELAAAELAEAERAEAERAAAERAAAELAAAELAQAERAEAERAAAELAAAELAEAERAAAAERAALDAIEVDAIEVDAPPAFPAPEPPSEVMPDDTHTSGPEDLDGDHESPHVVGTSHEPAVGTRSGRDGNDWSRPAPEQPVPVTADDVRSIVDEAIERFAARQAAQANPGMDAEAFSRAFAAAFGAAFSAMLDDRIAALNAGPAVAPPWVRYPAPMQVEVKKSFWTNMWHADVMLSVLAAVIVLVILIAWST